jgi:UDP-N-acetylmuramoyl-tripeptide--D-alanyl-D-alanine ligase
MMHTLSDAMADSLPVEWRERADALRDIVVDNVRAGDVVVVKGSNGSRMAPIVAALKDRHAAPADDTLLAPANA